eukprot:GHVS01043081.1.p1 GENE.GHVS01043081.1~~GHVS01043081.1.p1  ORF type:complete len:315 (-),score=49.36 GHVS01043081.1:309-1253(-)
MAPPTSTTPVKVAINGSLGRMGRRLCILCAADPSLLLVGALEYPDHPAIGQPLLQVEPTLLSKLPAAEQGCPPSSPTAQALQANPSFLCLSCKLTDLPQRPDVVIDFSAPAGCLRMASLATSLGSALVVGTTGLSPSETAELHGDKVHAKIPLIHAMNYSLGVNLLFRLAGQTAKALGSQYDIEVIEAHHNKKVDAPSGTAFGIIDSLCSATGRTRDDVVYGRGGSTVLDAEGTKQCIVGKRRQGEIGVHAVRMGSVVGDHSVMYGSDFETITLQHKAHDRDVFAAGALTAAKWLVAKKTPGFYSMEDVLFANS